MGRGQREAAALLGLLPVPRGWALRRGAGGAGPPLTAVMLPPSVPTAPAHTCTCRGPRMPGLERPTSSA